LLVRWLEHGVEAGFPWAMHWMAGYFHSDTGDYTGQDHDRARALYQRAADAGYGHSMLPLAQMLIRGEGGPADGTQALALLEAARAADMRFTEWPTGELYHFGAPGIEPDLQLAARWYMRATRQGHQPISLWDRLADLYDTLGDRARAVAALEIFEANLHDPHRPEYVHMRERLRARINAYRESLSEAEEAERYRVVLACRFNEGVCD
jgi:TPR repeat protein